MVKMPESSSAWLPIALAPLGRDLEVCVIDGEGVHSLVFPCRKTGLEWVNAASGVFVDIHPTHWRAWSEPAAGSGL